MFIYIYIWTLECVYPAPNIHTPYMHTYIHTYIHTHKWLYKNTQVHIQLQTYTHQLATIHDEISKRDSRIDEAEARTLRCERDAELLRNEVVKWRSEAAQAKLELSTRQSNNSTAASNRQTEKVHVPYVHTDMDASQQLNKVCMYVCCVCVCTYIYVYI